MRKKGFTLTEVLFALTIVGIVAALSVVGIRSNIREHRINAFSTKALNVFSSAVYEVMNSPTAPDNFICKYAIEYMALGLVTGNSALSNYTTGDGMTWTCTDNYTMTVTYPDDMGSCFMNVTATGVIQNGTCGELVEKDSNNNNNNNNNNNSTSTNTNTNTSTSTSTNTNTVTVQPTEYISNTQAFLDPTTGTSR